MTLRDLLPEDSKHEIDTDAILRSFPNRDQSMKSEIKVLDGNSGKIIGDVEECGQSLQIRKSRLRALLRQGISTAFLLVGI